MARHPKLRAKRGAIFINRDCNRGPASRSPSINVSPPTLKLRRTAFTPDKARGRRLVEMRGLAPLSSSPCNRWSTGLRRSRFRTVTHGTIKFAAIRPHNVLSKRQRGRRLPSLEYDTRDSHTRLRGEWVVGF